MDLLDLLKSAFEISTPKTDDFPLSLNSAISNFMMIDSTILKNELFQKQLLQTKEFEKVTKLHIMDKPIIKIEEEDGIKKTYESQIMKMPSEFKFTGELYLHSFFLSPAVIEEKDQKLKPYKKNVVSGRSIIDFKPLNNISVFFNAEDYQDGKIIKEELIEKFIHALDNFQDYFPPQKHLVMIRGVFNDNIVINPEAKQESAIIEI